MQALRPNSFDSFHGQQAAVDHLRVAVRSALRRKQSLGHVLLTGPRGLGKTTLGHYILPNEMATEARGINCAAIEKPQDLLPTLTTMKAGQILFLDEIHALPKVCVEHLYTVMEDFKLTIIVGDDRNARAMEVDLEPFTVIGATTREGLIPEPMRDRFKTSVRLDLYSNDEMAQVLEWVAAKKEVTFVDNAARDLVPACHGTARHAVTLIDACVDSIYGGAGAKLLPDETEIIPMIDDTIVAVTLKRLQFAPNGLSRGEIVLLRRLSDAPKNTLGLATLASMLDEEDNTIEQVYEPWLLRCGYIAKTPAGRMLTDAGRIALKQAES